MSLHEHVAPPTHWPLWRRQLLAIVRLELGRSLLTPRAFWVFFLAFVPAVIAGVHSVLASMRSKTCTIEHDTLLLAWIFQLFYLRVGIFFGCLGIFVRSFRGEMVDRTLQYYLIAPIRREILLVGKFLAGSLGSAVLFTLGQASCFLLMYLHHAAQASAFMLGERGLGQLSAYLGVTLLACIGYGAVFLALSLLFRNPVVPAVVFLGWESISGMLPVALQLLSVSFYLKPLFPVELPVVGISGLFTVVVEPVPGWLAALGPLLFSGVVVTLSALQFRKTQLETAD